MKSDGYGKGDSFGQVAEDLRRSDEGAFFGGKLREGLLKLRVAGVLAGVGSGEELLCGREFGGELCAVATVGAPGLEQGDAKNEAQENGDKSWPGWRKHN